MDPHTDGDPCQEPRTVVGARGGGRFPFLAAIGIAAVDVVLFVWGTETLT